MVTGGCYVASIGLFGKEFTLAQYDAVLRGLDLHPTLVNEVIGEITSESGEHFVVHGQEGLVFTLIKHDWNKLCDKFSKIEEVQFVRIVPIGMTIFGHA